MFISMCFFLKIILYKKIITIFALIFLHILKFRKNTQFLTTSESNVQRIYIFLSFSFLPVSIFFGLTTIF
jgi:hypothetical protein